MNKNQNISWSFLNGIIPKPETLGFALFLAINATGVWGGVFPFLPSSFQTPLLMFWFFISQTVVFCGVLFASVLGVYYYPEPTQRFPVHLAALPYAVGWVALIGAIYMESFALLLSILGGALLGFGSAGFYLMWQRLFASETADECNKNLILGAIWAAIFYYALYLIPRAITTYLIPLMFLPLFGLSIVLKSREINICQPMFEDVPTENRAVYFNAMRGVWRSALCLGAIGFCAGIMRSLAIEDVQVGAVVNLLSMGASMLATIVFYVLWHFKNLRFSTTSLYGIFFPVVTSALLLLPLFEYPYGRYLAACLYALYSIAVLLTMIQCAQISRDKGINPVFIYALCSCIVFIMHGIGFVCGTLVSYLPFSGMSYIAKSAMVTLFLLALIHFFGMGGFKEALSHNIDSDIELLSLNTHQLKAHKPTAVSVSPEGEYVYSSSSKENPPLPQTGFDRIYYQSQTLSQLYHLTAKETEILELLLRGNTVPGTAEKLVVSENTVRSHWKRIYTKLDVHKKQEVIELANSLE